ncbi:MAG TPA: GNAT family N-acetyltransferase [Dehalococcoidia bacterium]|nr:GNAT family N-acetyltransferase [Dehalococcoidia bacterium]
MPKTSPPKRLHIRRLRREEIPALAAAIGEISEAQIVNRWREQEMGYRELLVAEQDGELAGTVSIGEGESTLHLFALEVAPALRRRGIGSAIVRHVIDVAWRRGLTRVYLEVRVDNPARRLYHRLGFRRVGPEFSNAWWRYLDDGTQERVEEPSIRMVKRVKYPPQRRR